MELNIKKIKLLRNQQIIERTIYDVLDDWYVNYSDIDLCFTCPTFDIMDKLRCQGLLESTKEYDYLYDKIKKLFEPIEHTDTFNNPDWVGNFISDVINIYIKYKK